MIDFVRDGVFHFEDNRQTRKLNQLLIAVSSMSKDLNGRIEENKSEADIEQLDRTRPAVSDTSFTVVGLWDIAFVHAFACTFSALEDPAIHACPNFQPEVKKHESMYNRLRSRDSQQPVIRI
jgi:hypothetical protein